MSSTEKASAQLSKSNKSKKFRQGDIELIFFLCVNSKILNVI